MTSLAGALGTALRETRLTALLGYVVAQKPEAFRNLFHLKGDVLEVSIESDHDGDRADIEIQTTQGNWVVEAKCCATDPHRQARKYRADTNILITSLPTSGKKTNGAYYVHWQHLADHLDEIANASPHPIRFLCRDLVHYLEEHSMVRISDPVEVYARDVNTQHTLDIFLKAHLYYCECARSSRLPEAQYFAPHFGRSLASKCPGILPGISYVAKIECVRAVDSWEDFLAVAASDRDKDWLRTHKALLTAVRRRHWKRGDRRSVLFLGQPRMVFNPPIDKQHLQKGHGFLSKHFFSFDDLFKAWHRT